MNKSTEKEAYLQNMTIQLFDESDEVKVIVIFLPATRHTVIVKTHLNSETVVQQKEDCAFEPNQDQLML